MPDHTIIHAHFPLIQYVADGKTGTFNFHFAIFHDRDLKVYIDDDEQPGNFTVRGAGETSGGSVSFMSPPPSGAIVTLRRQITCERTTDFHESGEFRATALNSELDYLTALIQDTQADIGHCIKVVPTDRPAQLTLPPRELRRRSVLAFDEEGNVTVQPSAAALSGTLPSLDSVPPGEFNVHFSTADRDKLSSIAPGAQPNPPLMTADERQIGSVLEPRTFSPADIREMIRTHAPAPAINRVFGRVGDVEAKAGDYHAEQIADTNNKCMMTSTERAKLSGIEEGAQINTVTAVMGLVGSVSISALQDADENTISSGYIPVFDPSTNTHKRMKLSALATGDNGIDGGSAGSTFDGSRVLDGGNANA